MPTKARISFVEKKLILPAITNQPVRISFGLINDGDSDAVVTISDSTYFVSVDPTQKLFKYQSHPPMEFPVPAIPNAVLHGELRFPIQITAEKLEALNRGDARLFFFARAELRDSTGVYPMPFEEMYDGAFPGNLIAPPSDVVFE